VSLLVLFVVVCVPATPVLNKARNVQSKKSNEKNVKTIANNAVVPKTLEKQTRKTKCVRLKKPRGKKQKQNLVFC